MSEDKQSPGQKKIEDGQTVVNHLTELRNRLFVTLLIFILVLIASFFVAEPIYDYLTTSLTEGILVELNAFSFWDGVGIYMKIAIIIAICVTLPLVMYQVWAFVSPGLKEKERRATLKYIPFALLMFIVGILFGYFVVFPLAMTFTSSLNKQLGLVETYGIADYFKFMTSLVLPIALLFELPLVIMFLTQLRLLNPLRLRKMRRVAYFAFVFVSVLITPPDFFSAFFVIIPLVILYEISIFLSGSVHRRQLAAAAAREEKYK